MLSQNIFSIVFILCFTLTAYVRSQTCESIYPSSPCSNNDACGCIPLALADSIGICGVTKINCARLSPCDADFGCPSTNQMCVSHSSCGSTPICYPLSMTDPRLCPPLTTTTTSFPFYTTEGITTNGFDDNSTAFYTTEGTGTVETTTNSFDDNSTAFYTTEGTGTFEATTNGFDDNSTAFYTTGANGTFETTTSDFDDNSTSTYPSNWTILRYSSALTTNTSMNSSNNKYYELYRIRVNTSGQYQIRSVSHMDTYGCIYEEMDDTFNASNATSCNDDFNGNQFQLNVYLDSNVSYTLLFTTFGPNVTGPYTIEVYGENYLSEFYQIYVEEETTTAIYPTNSTESENTSTSTPFQSTTNTMNETESNSTDSSIITSHYSSVLTTDSNNFTRLFGSNGSYYYEAIEIKTNTVGTYTLISELEKNGSISATTVVFTSGNDSVINHEVLDSFGCLYNDSFSPLEPSMNLLQADDDGAGGNGQFRLMYTLVPGKSYIIVFTTFNPDTTGMFSIKATGPGQVAFTRVNDL